MQDLFAEHDQPIAIAPGAWLLKGYATEHAPELLSLINSIADQSPFRQHLTPGGHRMSSAQTGCGTASWVSDRRGYRYDRLDPETGQPWPALPDSFTRLASQAAADAGYADFLPDVCLINRYTTGSRMGLHQDKDEADFSAPIVSVSLGADMTFLFGGQQRQARPDRWLLKHGDVVVWGGPSRLHFHGVAPLGKRASHPLTGAMRYNLTFRRAFRNTRPAYPA
ncbi:DNA oxidative demethylase AlkB [Halopseudomonas salegens]|uniref:DNA-N1-methyladenine dioxygenase n=1 Tax=Halopseudomonas salegens TaxID=1434072 RepID=A0A1H2ER88_9GAMM|nr:DNA oxidative demethylase AlkB [Halopseudomonas salegens]SDT97248.1 DNA-N1-methyladenine dioxygenase [Halopseudomonas salegens]